ncbi:MAG: DUF3108 domain-containing protein [Alphaproteobacteria bacterium]|nr:DUF3108 domain-containing protein [Alphaproteobacteria bacterium]
MFILQACILSTFFLVIFPLQARATDNIQSMVYEVYASGIHAVQAKMEISILESGHYNLVMSAKTRGFLGKIVPWHGNFESYGWIMKDGNYRTELHKSTTTWKNETEIKEYKYNAQGKFDGLIITDHKKVQHNKKINNELTQDTIDIFTAALIVFNTVAKGKDCNSSSDVFDGKRRFKQTFVHKAINTLKTSKYNIFKGKAAQCYIEVEPVAGAWHKKPRGWMSIQEQGRSRGTMPTIWIAKLNEDGPAIPVKVRVKTKYGTLFMHLVKYDDGTKTIITSKYAKNEG